MDFIAKAKQLFTLYFGGETEQELQYVLNSLTEDCVIIGTGSQEFYKNRQEVYADLRNALNEHRELSFVIDSFEAQARPLSNGSHLVYGRLSVRGGAQDSCCSVTMDSRFAVVFVLQEDRWKVSYLHQSVPFLGQAPGEYYPRSLYNQLEEIRSAADAMKELAQKDSLTGLYNLRTLQEFFETRKEQNTWILLGDLDNFKRINDLYGHMEGNDVLKRVAASLRSSVRAQDVVARIGGDEFVILCHNVKKENVQEVLNRILKEIEKIQVDVAIESDIALDFGISLGAVEVGEGETMSDAIHRADQQMYAAKRSGKNRYSLDG